MLFLDQDQPNGKTGSYPNYPDVTDNHGADGNNVAFCDGHVEFISPKDWKRRYVMSEDANVSAWPP
jgi:prepilin-type processing-associated H-X9-DG protein